MQHVFIGGKRNGAIWRRTGDTCASPWRAMYPQTLQHTWQRSLAQRCVEEVVLLNSSTKQNTLGFLLYF